MPDSMQSETAVGPVRALSRRGLLCAAGVSLAAGLIAPRALFAADVRELGFRNLHTGERVRVPYWEHGAYQPEALAAINGVLRDHRNNRVHAIDTALLDLLSRLQAALGSRSSFEVISGYRSPESNEMLRRNGHGVVSGSMHLFGKAIDIRLPGCRLADLHKAACALKGGGVGLYTASNFVHVDTGRVRYW